MVFRLPISNGSPEPQSCINIEKINKTQDIAIKPDFQTGNYFSIFSNSGFDLDPSWVVQKQSYGRYLHMYTIYQNLL
jgi:hypothetical protein